MAKSKKSSSKVSSSKKSSSSKMDLTKMDYKLLSNKDAIQLIKSFNMTPIYSILVINLIQVAFISAIIHYLNNLQSCACYKDINNKNYSNITYLVIVEAIILTMTLISTIIISAVIFTMRKIKQSGGESNMYAYVLVNLIIILGITIYFVYNVYKLSQNINPECECTKNWLRYLLYIQAIIMTFGIIGNIGLLFKLLTSK
jgi:hypothetical protein